MICKTRREGEGAKSSFHEDLGLNVEEESREGTQMKEDSEGMEGRSWRRGSEGRAEGRQGV